ncbi:hypothetical protein BDD12DRAFT_877554 [Trichophaea hybrida]|nr:hypothetical protein BDD12DRAFT_877554 [Trichophaea hybrida]
MKLLSSLLAALAAAAVAADHAPQILYTAHFPHSPTSPVSGYLNLTTPSSLGMGITLSLTIPDASLGPFTYHIHTLSVPPLETGSFRKVGEIPFFKGRVGVSAGYTDPYVRIGEVRKKGRSVVVHDKDGKRIACADLVAVGGRKMVDEGMVVTKTVTTTVKPVVTTKGVERKMGVVGMYVPRKRRGWFGGGDGEVECASVKNAR